MWTRWTIRTGCLLILGVVWGCQKSPEVTTPVEEEPAWFIDLTDEVGLKFAHDGGPTGSYFMPQLTGGGAAFLDIDDDGRLDIYLVQNGGPESSSTNRLFRQGPDGRFEDVSAGSGLDVSGYGQGVAVGDANNDGRSDVVVSEVGRVRLFLNQGEGKFVERTEQAGIDNPLWATSAAFVDYDRDGRLDLVVVNYLEYNKDKPCAGPNGQQDFCGPFAFPGVTTKLFRNLGADGPTDSLAVRFQDVTVASGLSTQPGPGLGVVCADFNGDGWPDIFVANDGKPNHLWINQTNGTFNEEGTERGVAHNALGQAEANMGVAIGDVDGDGNFDLFVTHLREEVHRLWRQSPRGYFQDQTGRSGLTGDSCRSTAFGTLLADFDHDGAEDLFVANGRVKRDANDSPAKEAAQFWAPYRERNHLHANDGKGRFRNRSALEPAVCGEAGVWRAAACGDVDGDGALDLLVTRVDGDARLYRNAVPHRGNWLMIRTMDGALRRDAYGAEVTVVAGSRRWTRWVNPSYSYACSNDPRAHFGLGDVQRVDEIRVLWPDGRAESFSGQEVNQVITLLRGAGKALESSHESP